MKYYFLHLAVFASFLFGGASVSAETTQEALAAQVQAKLVEQVVQALEVQAVETALIWKDLGVCRNTQILSYVPTAGSVMSSLETLTFMASAEASPESFEVLFNKQSAQIDYTMLDSGRYLVTASVPAGVTGDWYVQMKASSPVDGACNDPLETSFSKPVSKAPVVVVKSQTPTAPTKTVTVVEEGPVSPIVADVVENEAEEEKPESFGGVATAEEDESTTSEDQVASSLWDVSQTGSVLGGVGNVLGGESCSTFASTWAWYVWLFVVWLYLIAIWLLLVTYVEATSQTAHYTRRLVTLLGVSTILMLGVWFYLNPCLTHAWVPITVILLGGLLFWLYEEKDVVQFNSSSHNSHE